MTLGRPSTYTDELADDICMRLILGESLHKITADESMPSERTVYTWMLKDASFLQKIAEARVLQAEKRLDEIHDIADDGSNDYTEKLDSEGNPTGEMRLNTEHVQRSKLRVDARIKAIELMAPKKYGKQLSLNHTGNVTVNRVSFGDNSDT